MFQFMRSKSRSANLPFIYKNSRKVLFFIFLMIAIGVGEAQEDGDNITLDSSFQPYRTGFHFQPPKNWMNDPNGPMYYKGIYHLFYQYNPNAATFGIITWAHSISYNLVDWIHLEHPLKPSESYDLGGVWSGSITFLPGEIPVIVYTGKELNNSEVQCLAYPKNLSDPFLIEWVKSDHNPLLTHPKGIGPDHFRDPTTAWLGKDDVWRMIVGTEIDGHGAALLYKSKDFLKWAKGKNPFHSSNKSNMWECPDFFPVKIGSKEGVDTSKEGEDTKHVLKASLSFNTEDHYVIGDYDSDTDDFIVDTDFLDSRGDLRYDYGMFYASKTFYDGFKKRRVSWGWIQEADNQEEAIQRGWAGLQSFPRSIWLDETQKKLIQWPIQELEKLRENEAKHQNREIKGGSVFEILGITASQADIEVSFQLQNLHKAEVLPSGVLDPQILCSNNNASKGGVFGPFGLLAMASKDLSEYTGIFFRIYNSNDRDYVVLMCSDQSKSSLATNYNKSIYGAFVNVDPREKISLRTLIDHSIIESFGGEGRACITARVYPKVAIEEKSHLYVFNYGEESVTISSLNAWSLRKAHISPAQTTYSSHNEL